MKNSYVRLRIEGKNPDLFFKLYVINKISYKNLKRRKGVLELTVKYEDYLFLENKKGIYNIYVIKEYGLIKYKNFILKNISLVIAFIISLIYLFVISNMAFNIDVIHNDKEIRVLVCDELQKNGISKYHFIPSFKKRRKILDKIVKENKDELEWLEIERKGSILNVKVTERIMNKKEESTKPRHIIAKKSGVIMSITASHGEILKKKNDYVNEGEILISGDIIKDETVKGQVRAEGSVYAETWYLVNVSYPLNYEETIYLSKVKNNLILSIFGHDVPLFKNYSKNYIENSKTIVKDKIFPFEIRIEKQRKIKVNKQKYTEKQALSKAIEVASKKIEKKLGSDEYIIDKKALNFTMNDSTIEVEVFFKVCENITAYKDVDESLLNKDNDLVE